MLDQDEAVMRVTRTITTTVYPTAHPSDPADTSFPTVVPDPVYYQRAGKMGERTLWVAFVLMLISLLVFTILSWRVTVSKRFYHSTSTAIVTAGTLAYFAMALHTGFTWGHFVRREVHDHVPDTFQHINRQVYWARTVYWIIAIPLSLVNLGAVAGLNGATIFNMMMAAVVMVLSGFFATLGHTHGQRWGWFAVACIAYLVIAYHLVVNGRTAVKGKTARVARYYGTASAYTIVVLAAYPIFWALTSISLKLPVNAEIIAYAAIDLLAQPLFALWLLIAASRMSEICVGLGSWWVHGFSTGEGSIRVGDDEEA